MSNNIDEAEKEKIFKELENFIRVPYKHCDKLILGSKIKYITNNGDFRIGGTLIKNMFPKYIVLMNINNRFTWCIDLKMNYIFIEDLEKKNKEKIEKNNLHKLYKNGLLSLTDENEDENNNSN